MRAALLLSALIASRAALAAPDGARLEVRSDPALELIGAVAALAGGAPGYYEHGTAYEASLRSGVSRYARHPVVERYRALVETGATHPDLCRLALLEGRDGDLPPSSGGELAAEEFRALLADFARVSGFQELYARLAPLREPPLAATRESARRHPLFGPLERAIGPGLGERATLLVSHGVEPVIAVSYWRRDPDGAPRLYAVTGPDGEEGTARLDFDHRRRGLWVELARARLEPDAEDLRALESSSRLLEETGGRCAPDWASCAVRQAAFALGARMTELSGDAASAAEWPVKYARVGMPHLPELMEAWKELERLPARERLAPRGRARLWAALTARARARPRAAEFSGTFREASKAWGECVAFLPDDASPSAPAALALAKRLSCVPGVHGADLRGKALLLVLLPGQEWLDSRWGELSLPVRIEPGRIVFSPRPAETRGAEISTTRPGLVSVARHPVDPSRPALVYASIHSEDLIALLAADPPSADYEVFDGTVPVRGGYYEKSRLPWRPK